MLSDRTTHILNYLFMLSDRLPEDVYFSEEPQIVRWDYDQKVWTLEGFTDHKFEEGEIFLIWYDNSV